MKLIVQNSGRVWGGNEKWLLAVASGLQKRGHEVVASCREAGVVAERLASAGVRTCGWRPGAPLDLARGAAFAGWLRRERPDALLLSSWRGTFWGALAGRAAGVPRVAVRLGIVRTPRPSGAALAFRRWVDTLIVNAGEIREAWRRGAPWYPQERIRVVFNCVEIPAADREAAAEWLRGELGLEPGTRVVCAVGHAERRKGFDVLLHAFARARLAGAHLAIVGAGSEIPALKRQALALGIEGRVSWPGYRDDVPRILAGSSLFVLSSRNEGMANVMLEAMAAGTPVVATDVSGVRAALRPDAGGPCAGWIVPPDDAEAMSGALLEADALIRRHPAAAAERCALARLHLERAFAPARMLDEVEEILFDGAAARPGARIP
jgi:glycosyltransferase involved in cell wall biosynthesis